MARFEFFSQSFCANSRWWYCCELWFFQLIVALPMILLLSWVPTAISLLLTSCHMRSKAIKYTLLQEVDTEIVDFIEHERFREKTNSFSTLFALWFLLLAAWYIDGVYYTFSWVILYGNKINVDDHWVVLTFYSSKHQLQVACTHLECRG